MIRVKFEDSKTQSIGQNLEVIPYSLNFQGIAKVDEFFHCRTQKVDDLVSENYLYGRKLKGRKYNNDAKKSKLISIRGRESR